MTETKRPKRSCETCGAPYKPKNDRSRFCSRPCLWKKNGGKNAQGGPIWWVCPKGYIEGRVWIDGKRVYYKQHRWIMEQHLGRPLLPTEDVHHRNGIKGDNRLENLEVIPHGTHSRVSNLGRKYRRGYTLELTEEERKARSQRAKQMGLGNLGRAAIARAIA